MEEPGDGLHEEQRHGRRWTSLAFGSGWTALGCIDPIYITIILPVVLHGCETWSLTVHVKYI